MDRQRTLEEAIAKTAEERRRKATWFLFKRLTPESAAGLDVYGVGLLRYLFLHLGFRNAEWHLTDADVQLYGACCSRSKFYDVLEQLAGLCVVTTELTASGFRRYQVSESNLVECLMPEDQREYWRILGRSPAEVELLVPSTVRTAEGPASPQYGQPVRNTDCQSAIRTAHYKEEEKPKEQSEKQPPPPPPCAGASPSATWDAVEAEAAEIAKSLGWCDWVTPIRAVRNRVSPDYVLRVLRHCRAAGGAYGAGALHRRIQRCCEGLAPEDGWPQPRAEVRAVQGRGTRWSDSAECRITAIAQAGLRAGKSDDAIREDLRTAGIDPGLW